MKATFFNPLAVRRTGQYDADGRALWQLTAPLFFYSETWGCWFMVPPGFITNYASVPRVPFAYLWFGDRVYEEPALHDFCYTAHALYTVQAPDLYLGGLCKHRLMTLSKRESDALFLEALLANSSMPEAGSYAMHKAVQWFGASSWDATTTIAQPQDIAALAAQATR